jgi:hypothetical protein
VPQALGKQDQMKPQISRWEGIIKIREEINEMETKMQKALNQ